MTIDEVIDDILDSNNVHPLIHTQTCVMWRLNHPRVNCNGCPSELDCCKKVTSLLVSFNRLNKDNPDYNELFNLIQSIARMSTLDEVRILL